MVLGVEDAEVELARVEVLEPPVVEARVVVLLPVKVVREAVPVDDCEAVDEEPDAAEVVAEPVEEAMLAVLEPVMEVTMVN